MTEYEIVLNKVKCLLHSGRIIHSESNVYFDNGWAIGGIWEQDNDKLAEKITQCCFRHNWIEMIQSL